MRWQVRAGKQRFSELLRRAAAEGPQVITRRGADVAVVLSVDEYRRLTGDKPDFVQFLLGPPDLESLALERASDGPRDGDL